MTDPAIDLGPNLSHAATLALEAPSVGEGDHVLRVVGRVFSPLVDPAVGPKQGDEGAPEAWIVLVPAVVDAARDLRAGTDAIVLTWLHLASRDVVTVHPRDDPARAELGVFSTRSADRPNPIGLHRVAIAAVEEGRILVRNLEAVDGTPVLDIKPVLDDDATLR